MIMHFVQLLMYSTGKRISLDEFCTLPIFIFVIQIKYGKISLLKNTVVLLCGF